MRPDGKKRSKIAFRLTKDAEGYPPADWEYLWAFDLEPDAYEIDNIPFFVKQISVGDVVRAEGEPEPHFLSVISRSDHSTVRLIFFDLERKDLVRSQLHRSGCSSEASHLPSLIAVDIPPDADFDGVVEYLAKCEDEGLLEYEESAIRR